jgi:hypothetical protein
VKNRISPEFVSPRFRVFGAGRVWSDGVVAREQDIEGRDRGRLNGGRNGCRDGADHFCHGLWSLRKTCVADAFHFVRLAVPEIEGVLEEL